MPGVGPAGSAPFALAPAVAHPPMLLKIPDNLHPAVPGSVSGTSGGAITKPPRIVFPDDQPDSVGRRRSGIFTVPLIIYSLLPQSPGITTDMPPSTNRDVPVMKSASSDARNSSAFAMSIGTPGRF